MKFTLFVVKKNEILSPMEIVSIFSKEEVFSNSLIWNKWFYNKKFDLQGFLFPMENCQSERLENSEGDLL